jgi:hypothetical protein
VGFVNVNFVCNYSTNFEIIPEGECVCVCVCVCVCCVHAMFSFLLVSCIAP